MDYIIAQQIRAGHPLVLDANFSPSLSNAKFQAWQAAHSCKVVQIVCQADLNELAHRFHERLQTDRHPGHADSGTFESFRQALAERKERGEDRPLDLKGHVITVDTTNFDDIDRSELIRQLKQHLS